MEYTFQRPEQKPPTDSINQLSFPTIADAVLSGKPSPMEREVVTSPPRIAAYEKYFHPDRPPGQHLRIRAFFLVTLAGKCHPLLKWTAVAENGFRSDEDETQA
jgi:hypothetical protein